MDASIPSAATHIGARHGPWTLRDILRPLERFDAVTAYERYTPIIDLAIYLVVFVGIAQATIGRRFPGPPGRAISIGIGASLAIGLSVAEARAGFTLADLGPIAAWLLAIAFGLMLLRFLKSFGMGFGAALATSALAAFAVALLAAPGSLEELAGPIVTASVLGAAVFFVVGAAKGTHFEPTYEKGFFSSDTYVAPSSRGNTRRKQTAKTESATLQRETRPRIEEAQRESRQTAKDLPSVLRAIRTRPKSRGLDQAITQHIDRAKAAAQDLKRRMQEARQFHQGITQMDKSLMPDTYRGALASLAPQDRQRLKQELGAEAKELGLLKDMDQLEKLASERASEMQAALQESAEALTEGDREGAAKKLERAIALEKQVEALTRKAGIVERKVERLARKISRAEAKNQ